MVEFFSKERQGSPAAKISHINDIKKFTYENDPDKHLEKKFIYIGDTLSDYEVTLGTDIEFFGTFLDGQIS